MPGLRERWSAGRPQFHATEQQDHIVEPSRCLANPLVTTMLHFWAAGPSQFRTFVPRDRGSPVLREQPSRRSCVSTTRLVSAPAFSICGMCIFLRFLPYINTNYVKKKIYSQFFFFKPLLVPLKHPFVPCHQHPMFPFLSFASIMLPCYKALITHHHSVHY